MIIARPHLQSVRTLLARYRGVKSVLKWNLWFKQITQERFIHFISFQNLFKTFRFSLCIYTWFVVRFEIYGSKVFRSLSVENFNWKTECKELWFDLHKLIVFIRDSNFRSVKLESPCCINRCVFKLSHNFI